MSLAAVAAPAPAPAAATAAAASGWILGLDVSLRSPGICLWHTDTHATHWIVFQQKKAQLLGLQRFPEDQQIQVKPALPSEKFACIDTLVQTVESIVRYYEPLRVHIEGYAYGVTGSGTSSSQSTLCELGGCLRLMLHRLRIPVYEFSPQTVKKQFTGSGRAQKIDMVQTWRQTHQHAQTPFDLGLDCQPHQSPLHDAIDAFALTQLSLTPPVAPKRKRKVVTTTASAMIAQQQQQQLNGVDETKRARKQSKAKQ
jgi:Holliday junction resolvasome RuvABC endonuclease subunit